MEHEEYYVLKPSGQEMFIVFREAETLSFDFYRLPDTARHDQSLSSA